MSWYCHPDTMTIAEASALADHHSLASRDTLAWRKAYRQAYEKVAPPWDGLAEYLESLDREIQEAEGRTR